MLPAKEQDPSLPQKRTRKTRFICVADTHNLSPYQGGFKVPKGDVLIHAGDMTKQGTYGELKKTVGWINKLLEDGVVERAIIIAGNHDLTLDPPFYASHGHNWHTQNPQDPETCLSLFSKDSLHPAVTFLSHASEHIILTSPTGPKTHFNVFGSPYTPIHITKVNDLCEGSRWAFQYAAHPSEESEDMWKGIPLDTDILVTHGPPYSHLDGYPVSATSVSTGKLANTQLGCESLRKTCWRVRPKLHVFGHIHEGRGCRRVMWRDGKHVTGMEEACACCHLEVEDGERISVGGEGESLSIGTTEMAERISSVTHDHAQMEWIDPGAVDERINGKMSSVDVTRRTRMFGGFGLRDGETLMVNAAIVKGKWPYGGVNKAVVVDLDLEVWGEDYT
ncbi:hypothetical protein H072_6639 [Dactylellina haptotyla CBS 200.50]|uniref:Calcineurin-like phosphoesterase domain-containing protein n=1 Tax=Dactylellina haptotyla (strain CBS 200.50) TaxID=1284197 RepID=S8BW71_DACHA|nr:hypothetical protein H072_6639 [Dactylellina haptotyla CBS 200.50]